TFFAEVRVFFKVDGSVNHNHIPLLLSPYGYSTYRGN
ncbi:hydroxyisourate hydrolase, partial [Citrobacter freundii]